MSNLFFNIKADKKSSVIKALTKNYGLGFFLSTKLCKKAGICLNYKINDLHIEHIENFTKILSDSKLKINQELKKKLLKTFDHSLQIKSYKGLRKVKGYPANGQRTRSNAKTAKKKLLYKSTK